MPNYVVQCEDEKSLLLEWREWFLSEDPDHVTGWNVIKFDIDYMLKRAQFLEIGEKFATLGRGSGKETICSVSEPKHNNSVQKSQTFSYLKCTGRVGFDSMLIFDSKFKETDYKLNTIAKKYLKKEKEDMSYEKIPDFWVGTDKEKLILISYCLYDSQLVVELDEKFSIELEILQMAKIHCISFDEALNKGQQFKLQSLIQTETKKNNFLIQDVQKDFSNTESFKGGFVYFADDGKQKSQLYNEIVISLDFNSLYPSIIIADNMCYSTYYEIKRKATKKIKTNPNKSCSPNFNKVFIQGQTETVAYFVKKNVRKSILASILERLISIRKGVKEKMKNEEENTLAYKQLNAVQWSVKIAANSIFGITAAQTLPAPIIAAAITARGRLILMQTIELIEGQLNLFFKKKYCFLSKIRVIYGDTDSVYIGLSTTNETLLTPKVVVDIRDFTADYCTNVISVFNETGEFKYIENHSFKRYIVLASERIIKPMIVFNKKRYMGLELTIENNIFLKGKKFTKGLSTVRRDTAKGVSHHLSDLYDEILDNPSLFQDLISKKLKLVIDEIKNWSFDNFKKSSTLSQPLEKYKSKCAGTCAIKNAIHYFNSISEGDYRPPEIGERFQLVILKELFNPQIRGKTVTMSDRAMTIEQYLHLKQKGQILSIDIDHYLSKFIDSAGEILAIILGKKKNEIIKNIKKKITPTNQSVMTNYFKPATRPKINLINELF